MREFNAGDFVIERDRRCVAPRDARLLVEISSHENVVGARWKTIGVTSRRTTHILHENIRTRFRKLTPYEISLIPAANQTQKD